MNGLLSKLRASWAAMPAAVQSQWRFGLLLTAALVLVAGLLWLEHERNRTSVDIAEAQARLESLQATVAEIDRLRRESVPPVTASGDAVRAVLRGAGLTLSVTPAGTDRLRLQGNADFARLLPVLALLHRDHRLSVVTLDVARDGSEVRIDAVLGGSGQ